jgi:hypothetical protein
MKHLKHHCEPLQAAAHTGRMSYDQAIDEAYRYGHEPVEGLSVDAVVENAKADRKDLPRSERHCPPLKEMVASNRMHGDAAIEAAYKLGVEEKAAKVEEPQDEAPVEESQDEEQSEAVEEPKVDKKAKPVRRPKKPAQE